MAAIITDAELKNKEQVEAFLQRMGVHDLVAQEWTEPDSPEQIEYDALWAEFLAAKGRPRAAEIAAIARDLDTDDGTYGILNKIQKLVSHWRNEAEENKDQFMRLFGTLPKKRRNKSEFLSIVDSAIQYRINETIGSDEEIEDMFFNLLMNDEFTPENKE